ncbi:MAG: pyridoxamine 5'-phosphate oxidase, partial [Actinomycetota bacterium]
EDDPELTARLAHPDYPANPERGIVIEITAWDINCPQHITPRYAEDDVREAIEKLQDRILELEAEVKSLRDA